MMINDAVQHALDQFNSAYKLGLSDQIEDWEEIARPILEEIWGEGYSSGISDCEKRLGV